ncbi:oligosaccharide flippase family protein [Enterococcus dongliensis]|uniref:lipopolysaccharide biosynthesis protein n=1 Tax=Enterococcus dongliensis TaxID=2559925 RepID=UPI002890621D|nr:oligosaccharide flippase family protein [Enterococcus dongliensis]MDT2644460.1 oligosaccharide flippase family protein [Enterococcus dongliensis]
MQKSRLYYSMMNSSISTIVFFLKLVMQFVVRTYFIRVLGVAYLGINGLFSNVLSLLSLAELGVGTSIVYSMYKPIANNDQSEIQALMVLYKKAYHYIGFAVAIIGLALIPFLHFFSDDLSSKEGFVWYYLLFLGNSVLSYFFTYKRSLLIANQRSYLVNINDFIFLLISNIFQIYLLLHYGSFTLYLLVQLVFTLLGNFSISYKVDKDYKFLKKAESKKLGKDKIKEIKKNVVGNMSSKIGGVIVMGTDSILISSFVGLAAVGYYSNYTMIINNVQNLCKQVTNSITASIGNYIVTADKKQSLELFKRHLFVNYTMIYFATLILVSVLNPFIVWWIGEKYILPSLTVTLIIINLVVQMFRNTNFVFIDSFGLYWIQRWKSVIEATINLVVSLILLAIFNLGINGVLLGTIASSFGYVMWIEAYYIFKYGLKEKLTVYIIQIIKYILLLCISIAVVFYSQTFFEFNGFAGLILKTLIACCIGLFIYIITFCKSNEFLYVKNLLIRIIKR